MKPATVLGVVVFALVALMHLLRLVFQTEVLVGGAALPMWVSAPGFVLPAVLAIAIWREARETSR